MVKSFIMTNVLAGVLLLLMTVIYTDGAVFNNAETVAKARCYSNCLTEASKSSAQDEGCQSSLCQECIKPCQVPFTTIDKCKSLCVESPICTKSCDFLLKIKNSNVLLGKNTITKKPGVPVEVTKTLTSITLSWQPAEASEGSVVYLLKEKITGDFNVRLKELSNLVFFQPKAVLNLQQVCSISLKFRFKFEGLKFHFVAVAITENSSMAASSESSPMEMTRPNAVVDIGKPHFRFVPTIGDDLLLTATVTPDPGQEHLITKYGLHWKSERCQSGINTRSTMTKDASRNVSMILYEKIKACNHTLKVYSIMECIPSLPTTLKYEYKGCRFVEDFKESLCFSFDPPPTPDAARAVRNLSIAPLEVQDDFRLKTTFMWQSPTFSFGAVESYHVEYGDVNKMIFKFWIPTRRVVTDTFLKVMDLLPNTTVRVRVTPKFSNAAGVKRTITFTTPAIPQSEINVRNLQSSDFTFSLARLFSINVTWSAPEATNGLQTYQITTMIGNKKKRVVVTSKTSKMFSRLLFNVPLVFEVKPLYRYEWIKPDGVVLKIKTPAPYIKDAVVRNLKLSNYTIDKIDKTLVLMFSWKRPALARFYAVVHYSIHYHLVDKKGQHLSCPSYKENDACQPPTTTSTKYLIPKVSPSDYIIFVVKPVFRDEFVQGFENVITHAPLHSPLKFSCKGKGPGYHTDVFDCSAFYQCDAFGGTFHKHCPSGLFWNQGKRVCDYPRNVHCPNQKGGKEY